MLDPDQENAELSHATAELASTWIDVYVELLAFEESMLNVLKERMSRLTPAAREIAEQQNLPALEGDCRNYRDRLDVWRHRLKDLQAAT
jgi:hypothetical protein